MKRHGLMYKDEEAFDRYTEFKEEVMAILDTQRSSPIAQKSAQKIKKRLKEYGRSNESTFSVHVFPLLLKDSHHKPEAIGEVVDINTAERKAAERDFLDNEQIKILRDQEFVRTLLPSK